jgi:hypothetical protein
MTQIKILLIAAVIAVGYIAIVTPLIAKPI